MCPQFELAIEGSSDNLNEQAIALQSDDDETKQHPNVNKIASSRSLHYNPKTIKRSSTQNVKKIASSRSIQNESFSKTQRYRVGTLIRGSKLGSKLANELRNELGISSSLLVNELRHELGVSSSLHKNPSQSLGQRSASHLKEIRRISVNKQKGRSKKDSTSEEPLADSPLLAYALANHGPTKLVSPRGEEIRNSSTWTYESSTST
jgi:hypothetical protein